MSIARHHAEWLSLLEISGPFLSMPVLLRAFPQGLDAHDPTLSARSSWPMRNLPRLKRAMLTHNRACLRWR